MAIGLTTDMSQGQTLQEDVVNAIYNVDYTITPFVSRIGESAAMNVVHNWIVDYLPSPALNATVESSDATVVDEVEPVRKSNIVQLFRKVITVSDTNIAVPHYGMNDPFEYQTQKNMKAIARDIELAAIQGTRVSGASGTARQADGAIALITTNKTAQTSGTCFKEAVLLNLLQMVYSSGTDEEIDYLLTGPYLKLAIDNFSTNVTRYLGATEFEQALRVDTYVSSFGQHKVAMSRQLPSSAVLGVDTSKWRTAWLVNRRLSIKPLGKTGSSTKGLLEGEATWEALNEKSSFYASGYFNG